jgi:hypothetical protein
MVSRPIGSGIFFKHGGVRQTTQCGAVPVPTISPVCTIFTVAVTARCLRRDSLGGHQGSQELRQVPVGQRPIACCWRCDDQEAGSVATGVLKSTCTSF